MQLRASQGLCILAILWFPNLPSLGPNCLCLHAGRQSLSMSLKNLLLLLGPAPGSCCSGASCPSVVLHDAPDSPSPLPTISESVWGGLSASEAKEWLDGSVDGSEMVSSPGCSAGPSLPPSETAGLASFTGLLLASPLEATELTIPPGAAEFDTAPSSDVSASTPADVTLLRPAAVACRC